MIENLLFRQEVTHSNGKFFFYHHLLMKYAWWRLLGSRQRRLRRKWNYLNFNLSSDEILKTFFRVAPAWSLIYDKFDFKGVTVMQPALRDNHKFREEFLAEVRLCHHQ